MSNPQVIDVDAVRHETPESAAVKSAQRIVEKLLGKSAAERVEAAAEKVETARKQARDQFQAQVEGAQARLDEFEKKAHGFVSTVQSTVQGAANVAKETVQKEREGVEKRFEHVVGQILGKVGDKKGLRDWLELPADVRKDVLTAAGIASHAQVGQVLEEIAALKAEMHTQFVALQELLAERAEGKPAEAAETAGEKKPRGKKATHAEA